MQVAAATSDDGGRPAWIGRRTESSPLARMPLLGDLMEATAEAWTESFAQLSAAPAEMKPDGLEVCKIESLATRWKATTSFIVVRAVDWNAEILIVLDRSFVGTMVDALFGGDGDDAGLDPAGPMTRVEQQIADVAADQVADALRVGVASHCPSVFRRDRLLVKPDFACLGKPGATIMVARLVTRTLGRAIAVEVMVPLTALEPFAAKLATPEATTAVADDPEWSQQLEAEVGRSMTTLRAAIDLPAMDLGALARLTPGQVLRLPFGAGHNVKLSSGTGDLFRCDLGQASGLYTLRVDEALGPPSASDHALLLSDQPL